MANTTPTSTVLGSDNSPDSSSGSATLNTDGAKIGRPSGWSPSRQRKLGRLYSYTTLKPKDIREALREKDSEWIPGLPSINKTTNFLLDKEPRKWRPKTREDMNGRMIGLSNLKLQRRSNRKIPPEPSADPLLDSTMDVGTFALPQAISGGYGFLPGNDGLFSEFSEAPIDDLHALFPYQGFDDQIDQLMSLSDLVTHHLPLDFDRSTQGDALAATLHGLPYSITHTSNISRRLEAELPAAYKNSLLSTELSTSSLKRRLSKSCSPSYLKNIARLLQTYSISEVSLSVPSGSCASTKTWQTSSTTNHVRTISDVLTIGPASLPTIHGPSRAARMVLPDALLVLDRYIAQQGICLPGLGRHDSGNCWCLNRLEGQLWIHKHGLIGSTVEDPPRSLTSLDLQFRDAFGNNVLHMLAARGAELRLIIEALERGVDGNERNVAGQNFLHTLPRQSIRWLAGAQHGLMWFLQKLNNFNIRFHDCDVFGRNFFHLLTRQARHLDRTSLEVLNFLNVPIFPRYDAFGWDSGLLSGKALLPSPLPIDHQVLETFSRLSTCRRYRVSCLDTARTNLKNIPNQFEDTDDKIEVMPRRLKIPNLQTTEAETLMYDHARMLQMACLSIEVPSIQDPLGRNGLQCLAEVSLCLDNSTLERANEPPKKRKRGASDSKAFPKRLTFRYGLIQSMLDEGVDLNNYDSLGNTVLMTYVTHLPDGEDDKTLTEILKLLIVRGADIHRRNRVGETALHVAVRLGRKIATRELLEHGANVHARTAEGSGMLEWGEIHYRISRENMSLYASIMACMALCMSFGAVAAPTWVQEWSA
ncbi:hypothetical protein VTL71DRAFT_15265 [Oculimacula yallundae]|uniref:Ankyrin n=1 Tax=Oculimacula yallundae TaxID=86028 RepID=A0ABR4CHE2_9HELO